MTIISKANTLMLAGLLIAAICAGAAPAIKNPLFSEGTEAPTGWTQTWTATGKIAVRRDNATYHSEPASLRLESVGGPAKGQVMQSFEAAAGGRIDLTGHLRAEGATALLGVMAYDADWQGLGFTAVGNALDGFGWVKAAGSATLPARTARAAVVLMIEGNGRVWLDDVATDGSDPGKGAKPRAAEPSPKPAPQPGPRKPASATDPAEGFYPDFPQAWQQILEGQVKRAGEGPAPMVFLGDSLTLGWNEQPIWNEWKSRGAVNFGVGGDGTPQVLWRIDHGILDRLDPQVVVLQIGINNVWPGFDAADTVKGILAVVERIRAKAAKARIIVCGNTHFFDPGDGKGRQRVCDINSALKASAGAANFVFVDFSGDLIDAAGNLRPECYGGDKLHLAAGGYRIWAQAIAPHLDQPESSLRVGRHIVLPAEPDRFAGWPANNGLWSWDGGKEILVGCTFGAFKEQPGHNIENPYRSVLYRSTDAGLTWTLEDPEGYVGDGAEPVACPGALDFGHRDLAIRCVGSAYHGTEDKQGAFFASTDRGRTWRGPFRFNGLNSAAEQSGREQTPRTDYLPISPRSCLFFLSSRPAGGKMTDDRAYVARTDDGGLTFRHVAWMVPPADRFRAVMPSTALVGKDDLLAAVRRRTVGEERCWIDAYFSRDGGQTWAHHSEIGDTGTGNGNPPALLKLRDGRLLCAYGDRKSRRMVVRLSTDRGATWTPECVVRDEFKADRFNDADFGYPRLVERPDGSVLVIYYFATETHPAAHIASTILHVSAAP